MTGRVSAQASGREWAAVAAIAAASLAVRAVFAASVGIFQDEALLTAVIVFKIGALV